MVSGPPYRLCPTRQAWLSQTPRRRASLLSALPSSFAFWLSASRQPSCSISLLGSELLGSPLLSSRGRSVNFCRLLFWKSAVGSLRHRSRLSLVLAWLCLWSHLPNLFVQLLLLFRQNAFFDLGLFRHLLVWDRLDFDCHQIHRQFLPRRFLHRNLLLHLQYSTLGHWLPRHLQTGQPEDSQVLALLLYGF